MANDSRKSEKFRNSDDESLKILMHQERILRMELFGAFSLAPSQCRDSHSVSRTWCTLVDFPSCSLASIHFLQNFLQIFARCSKHCRRTTEGNSRLSSQHLTIEFACVVSSCKVNFIHKTALGVKKCSRSCERCSRTTNTLKEPTAKPSERR